MNRIYQLANWKALLPLFLLVGVFAGYLFPKYNAQITKIAKEKLASLDTRMSYNTADVDTLFEKMGAEGRDIYCTVASRVDMAFPVAYSLFLCLLLAALLKSLTPPGSRWRWLCLLPFAGALFDYLENFSVIKLLATHPALSDAQVAWGSQMTTLKWTLLLGVAAVVVVLVVLNLWRRIAR